jgi:hypothetical protein
VTQYVQIAIVGADLKKGMIRTVPLVENFLDQILTLAELKPHRPLVCLPTGIALYSENHPFRLWLLARSQHYPDSYAALSADYCC